MGEKASCGQQDSRNAAAQTMVGDALSAKQREMEAGHNLENARAFTHSFVYFSLDVFAPRKVRVGCDRLCCTGG